MSLETIGAAVGWAIGIATALIAVGRLLIDRAHAAASLKLDQNKHDEERKLRQQEHDLAVLRSSVDAMQQTVVTLTSELGRLNEGMETLKSKVAQSARILDVARGHIDERERLVIRHLGDRPLWVPPVPGELNTPE